MKKKFKNNVKIISVLTIVCLLLVSFTGCDFLESKGQDLKGDLIGTSYNIYSYDNFGNKTGIVSGQNINISGNIVKEYGVDSDGYRTTQYSLSSVLTITIDGNEFESCGDTLVFAEKGLQEDVNFVLEEQINSENNKGLTGITSISAILNKYKNYFGKSRVVVIKSQLGIPICAYSGESVYWEIPNDLPKMTKLMIDGKVLYIHRSNFQIYDKDLIK